MGPRSPEDPRVTLTQLFGGNRPTAVMYVPDGVSTVTHILTGTWLKPPGDFTGVGVSVVGEPTTRHDDR